MFFISKMRYHIISLVYNTFFIVSLFIKPANKLITICLWLIASYCKGITFLKSIIISVLLSTAISFTIFSQMFWCCSIPASFFQY